MLSPQWANAADTALDRLHAATAALSGVVTAQQSNPIDQAWQWLVETTGGLDSHAHSAQVLYTAMVAKRDRLTTDEEAETFVKDCGQYADVSDALDTAYMISARGGVTTVAAETATDIIEGAQQIASWTPYVAAGVLVLVLVLVTHRA